MRSCSRSAPGGEVTMGFCLIVAAASEATWKRLISLQAQSKPATQSVTAATMSERPLFLIRDPATSPALGLRFKFLEFCLRPLQTSPGRHLNPRQLKGVNAPAAARVNPPPTSIRCFSSDLSAVPAAAKAAGKRSEMVTAKSRVQFRPKFR